MIRKEQTLEINASPKAVWGVIGNFMHIDEFAPLVKSVDALTDLERGVGAKRRCHFVDNTSLVEEVIAWEENRGFRISLSELAGMHLHEAYSELIVEPLGKNNERSKVFWIVEYRVKYGLFGWIFGQTMMKMMMGKILNGNLKGIADKLRSDKIATTKKLKVH